MEGRRIAELAVLADLAEEIGLDRAAFATAFDRMRGAATQLHIVANRALLARVGGTGFPTFALERGGRYTVIDIAPNLGRADLWTARLLESVGPRSAIPEDATPVCGTDGCGPANA